MGRLEFMMPQQGGLARPGGAENDEGGVFGGPGQQFGKVGEPPAGLPARALSVFALVEQEGELNEPAVQFLAGFGPKGDPAL